MGPRTTRLSFRGIIAEMLTLHSGESRRAPRWLDSPGALLLKCSRRTDGVWGRQAHSRKHWFGGWKFTSRVCHGPLLCCIKADGTMEKACDSGKKNILRQEAMGGEGLGSLYYNKPLLRANCRPMRVTSIRQSLARAISVLGDLNYFLSSL